MRHGGRAALVLFGFRLARRGTRREQRRERHFELVVLERGEQRGAVHASRSKLKLILELCAIYHKEVVDLLNGDLRRVRQQQEVRARAVFLQLRDPSDLFEPLQRSMVVSISRRSIRESSGTV